MQAPTKLYVKKKKKNLVYGICGERNEPSQQPALDRSQERYSRLISSQKTSNK